MFTQDLHLGMKIGFKVALTCYVMIAALFVAISGVGFIMVPMVLPNVLDTIWDA